MPSPSKFRRLYRSENMAKGMNKRKRDEKKPKKEAPRVIAAAPSTKTSLIGAALKVAK